MWMRWHHKFADGPGEAEWLDVGGGSDREAALGSAKEWVIELAQEYSWSEHYRGIEYELVEMPPRDVIEARLRDATSKVALFQKDVLYLQELLKKATT